MDWTDFDSTSQEWEVDEFSTVNLILIPEIPILKVGRKVRLPLVTSSFYVLQRTENIKVMGLTRTIRA